MKRITTGDVARALTAIFPQATEEMVRKKVESGDLRTLPRFSEKSWWYVDPAGIPEFLLKTLRLEKPQAQDVMRTLGLG